jgi:hypothetical protein
LFTDQSVAIGKALAVNSSLTGLVICNASIDGKGGSQIGEALSRNTSLRTLSLRGNELGDTGAAGIGRHLGDNSSLNHLSLGDNEIGKRGAETIGSALSSNSSLTSLFLDSNKLGEEGARAIFQGVTFRSPNERLDSPFILFHLNLSGNCVGGAIGQVLGDQTRPALGGRVLAELNLESCGIELVPKEEPGSRSSHEEQAFGFINFRAAAADKREKRQRDLRFAFVDFANSLQNAQHLRILRLSGNPLNDEGALALADGLWLNWSLEQLFLGSCGIGAEGANAIANALTRNRHSRLQSISLRNNAVDWLSHAWAEIQTPLVTVDFHDNPLPLPKEVRGNFYTPVSMGLLREYLLNNKMERPVVTPILAPQQHTEPNDDTLPRTSESVLRLSQSLMSLASSVIDEAGQTLVNSPSDEDIGARGRMLWQSSTKPFTPSEVGLEGSLKNRCFSDSESDGEDSAKFTPSFETPREKVPSVQIAKGEDGSQLLYEAARDGLHLAVQSLVQAGADPEWLNLEDRNSPLVIASKAPILCSVTKDPFHFFASHLVVSFLCHAVNRLNLIRRKNSKCAELSAVPYIIACTLLSHA